MMKELDSKKVVIMDSLNGYAIVNDDCELHVCLCKKACDGHVTIKDLLMIYPGTSFSIRKDQLEES